MIIIWKRHFDAYPNPGVIQEDGNTPTIDKYDDMIVDERLEDDEEEAIDKYLNVKLILGVGTNNEWCGRVVKCLWGPNGKPVGHAHDDHLFDTCEYEVEFMDGTREKYQANVIAKSMFAQVDDEG